MEFGFIREYIEVAVVALFGTEGDVKIETNWLVVVFTSRWHLDR